MAVIVGAYKLKVLLVGDYAKTNIIRDFAFGSFNKDYKLTIGCDIFTSHVIANNEQDYISLAIWDISNQDRFRFFRSNFYRGAAGAIIVYDITRLSTFQDLIKWAKEIVNISGRIPIVIFGIKGYLDESRVVDRDTAEQFTDSLNNITPCQYFEDVDYLSFERCLSYLTSEMHLNQANVRLDPADIVHVPFKKVKNAQKLSLQEVLDNLKVTIVDNEALIFKSDHYFRVNLNNGKVHVHAIDDDKKCANICLIAGFDGWTNTNLNSFKVGLIAKISSIVWNDLPSEIYPQILDFLQFGKAGPNLFPKNKVY
ncbi:MAG: hypothetical protein EAX96_19655 [Candidatus Lokiarchaeota archaeon]|nr:hypothetical protein [Candidatus Lokiarchaeota archaeon]